MRPAKDVDDYIANAPEYTRPILVKLRRIFQQASPELEEAIKWGVPFFTYKGMVGGFAAYQKHVSWGLWKATLLNDPDGILGRGIMNGGKITKVSEIPPAAKLVRLIQQAMALNDAGIKVPTPRSRPAPAPALEPPADFAAAIEKSDRAAKHYAALSPSCKREYVKWITEARRPETRAKRIQTAVERISDGKAMN